MNETISVKGRVEDEPLSSGDPSQHAEGGESEDRVQHARGDASEYVSETRYFAGEVPLLMPLNGEINERGERKLKRAKRVGNKKRPAERPRRDRVAIVGGGPTRKKAPYKNKNWDIWAFSSTHDRYPRVTRWFEIHALADLKQQLAGKKKGRRTYPNYMRFMRRLRCPVYMQRRHRSIPYSVPFPKKKVLKAFGRCFTSTASYLIALAILEGYKVIGLWGIDLRGSSYDRQRPAIEYLLGVARKRGIRVYIPRGATIRVPKKPKFVGTRVLYAYDWRSKGAWWRERVLKRLRRRRRKRVKKRRKR